MKSLNRIIHRDAFLLGLKKIPLIFIGITVASLGIAITYKSGIGNSPMATITDGVSQLLDVTYGTANVFINIVFLFISYFYVKEKINIGTIVVMFSIGSGINLFVYLLSFVDLPSSYAIPANLLGSVITSIGISSVVLIDYGLGPLELMTEIVLKIIKSSYRTAKMLFDATLLVLGITLGGVYGLGTIFNILIVGFVMQIVIKTFRKEHIVH